MPIVIQGVVYNVGNYIGILNQDDRAERVLRISTIAGDSFQARDVYGLVRNCRVQREPNDQNDNILNALFVAEGGETVREEFEAPLNFRLLHIRLATTFEAFVELVRTNRFDLQTRNLQTQNTF
ncbi:MAG: hypothetical protein HZB76_04075 [Chlamydiae bacterium]|nr:hypothetical protein [Chlamydiota bacterium]